MKDCFPKIKLSIKQKVTAKLFIKLLPCLFLFFLYITAFEILGSAIIGEIIGIPFLFYAFVSLRYKYNSSITYHNESTKKCILLSIGLFTIATLPMLTINTSVSLLFCVPIAILMTLFLHTIGKKDYELKLSRDMLNSFTAQSENEKPTFNVENCTERELIDRCKEIMLSEHNTELAIEFFIKKTKQSILADRLCIEEKSVQIRKKRLKKKLNKF